MAFDIPKWWGGLDPKAKGALIGGAVGAGGLGIANSLMAPEGKKGRGFLTGALMGGLGGAGAGAAISHYYPQNAKPVTSGVEVGKNLGKAVTPPKPVVTMDSVNKALDLLGMGEKNKVQAPASKGKIGTPWVEESVLRQEAPHLPWDNTKATLGSITGAGIGATGARLLTRSRTTPVTSYLSTALGGTTGALLPILATAYAQGRKENQMFEASRPSLAKTYEIGAGE